MRGSVFRRCTSCGSRLPDAERTCERCGSRRFTWTYRATVSAPGSPRRQVSKGGFQTQDEAARALRDVKASRDRGLFLTTDKLTLRKFVEEKWLPDQRTRLRQSTFATYETNLRQHVLNQIGHVRLDRLTRDHLERLYEGLSGPQDTDRRTLSLKSVRNIHGTVRKVLNDAMRRGYLPHNVALTVDLPAAARPEMQTWSAQELALFLDQAKDDPFYVPILLAATTGMRRGEVLGLRWRDVDLLRGRVAVRQTLVCVGYEIVFSKPKTKKSVRTVPLDNRARAALSAQGALQAEHRLCLDNKYIDSDLVFAEPDGRPVHPQRLSAAFERLARSFGLRPIRFHDLRHSFATLALQAGVFPKVVSEILGHSTVAFTMDVYSHAIPAMQEEAVERVSALIFGEGGGV